MIISQTVLDGVYLMEPELFGDARGWFMETYSCAELKKKGLDAIFIQDNHSFSAQKNTLRGLHFQNNPMAQTKLVRCTSGAILDVAVDIRKGSKNYKKWISIELSADNKRQIYIPKGFAHAFLTLTDNVEVQYKVDEYYSKECDRSIRYDDQTIGIEWGDVQPILSDKDRNAVQLDDCDSNFTY